jgi:hypothetical protein
LTMGGSGAAQQGAIYVKKNEDAGGQGSIIAICRHFVPR